ncbi:exodeoxyribonuclease VII large subunit [Glaesserella sp.]|uniref:exodeoxyribonuclease VII large subunit n=1 Tax=Glaesserella sp. TaxID=2094731 RepID=UPI0035A13F17
MQNNILTISQLNYSVKNRLEAEFGHVWLIGEISNFSQPVSGHWYLTLKDDRAQVRCAMFRMKNMRVNFRPQNGMQVLVRASVSLFEPRGDYQVIIDSMQPAGDGLLQQQFERLKMKLAEEGLFAQEKKKPIPSFVKRVGIMTSSSGAALQDILNILKRRDPSLHIVIYPTLVQGKEAAQDIVNMLRIANLRRECDVLIVGRGGGSLEDLWCFNEESVARAIFDSQIPIISAVGHETDVTIADFVADLRAPTPSAAAELVSRDQRELYRQLQHQADKASMAFDRLWSEKVSRFERLKLRLNAQHPMRQVQQRQQQLSHAHHRIGQVVANMLFYRTQKLLQLKQRLQTQHPQRNLTRQQQQLTLFHKRIIHQFEQLMLRKTAHWETVVQRVERNPLPHYLAQHRRRWDSLEQRLTYSLEKKMQRSQQSFQQLCMQLDSLSPLKVLSRGYSVTQNQEGKALVSVDRVVIGELITTTLEKGRLISQVIDKQS